MQRDDKAIISKSRNYLVAHHHKTDSAFERLSTQNNIASPFGICFRPKNKDDNGAKFPNWVYKPSYLPASLEVNVAKDSVVSEPMWFFLSFASRPDLAAKENNSHLCIAKIYQKSPQLRFLFQTLNSTLLHCCSIHLIILK